MKKEIIISKIKNLLIDCCIISTGIIIFICFLSIAGLHSSEISVAYVGSLLLVAFITSLVTLLFSLFNPKNNLSSFLLHVLRFCTMAATVLGFGALAGWGLFDDPPALLLTLLSVVIIYGLVWSLNHWMDQRIASDINKQLDQYKKTGGYTNSDKA